MNRTYNKLKVQQTILRYLALFSGLFIIANGIVLMINAHLGVTPWDVLHIGLSTKIGLTIGQVIQGTGLLLIAVSYFFKIKPSIGTILNMIFLGLFVDLVIAGGYVPQPELLWLRIVLYICGVVIYGFGIAFYISPNLGAGPRDSLMLALTRVSRFRVGTIRTFLEVTVATIGYFLGGPLGIGTVIFALSIGLFMELGFTIVSKIKKTKAYSRIWGGSYA
jgi:uncharacterized protein